MKDKILAIEFLKFIAALMITNSHFKPLYPEAISALGTFGAPGNALFFFASGYVLSLGKLNTNGINWYKKRIKRLWLTTLVWNTFFSYLIFNTSLSFAGVWLGGGAWFVHCIAIYYILYYFVRKLKLIRFSIIFSFIFSIIYFFTFLPISKHSIYQNDWHYICFFSIMMLGAYCAIHREDIKSTQIKKNIIISAISFVLFYIFQAIGKGKEGSLYYVQVLSLLPLHSFIYYFYKVIDMDWCNKLMNIKPIKYIIMSVSALTLEIYLVGFSSINTNFNHLFPLNLLLIFIIICIQAYLLKILTNILTQILGDGDFNLRQVFKLF